MDELVEFPNLRLSHTLRGTLTKPIAAADSKHVVILCHGLNCDRNSSFLPALSQHLSSNGFSCLRFDFSGSGDSEGEWSYSNYAGEADDLEAAVIFLKKIGMNPIAVVGHSKAATVVLIHAATYHTVKKYVHISGRFNMGISPAGRFSPDNLASLEQNGFFDWQGKRITAEAFGERSKLNVASIVSKIPKGPQFLLIHCADDVIIPAQDSQDLQSTNPELFPLLKIFPKGRHSLSSVRKPLFSEIVEFI